MCALSQLGSPRPQFSSVAGSARIQSWGKVLKLPLQPFSRPEVQAGADISTSPVLCRAVIKFSISDFQVDC